jgi:serpin B
MKYLVPTLLLTGFVGLAAARAADDVVQGKPADSAGVVKDNNAFALDLYHQVSGMDGNLFFSPYSISTALAMTYAGARGETAAEMAKTLHFTLGQDELHPAFGQLIRDINGDGKDRKYQLTTANRLWGQKGYDFQADFLKLTQKDYGAGLQEVNFAGAPDAARKTINAWVEEQTKDKIKELLQPGIITGNTRLVLTNAIYFKASWFRPFRKEATAPGKFRLPDGTSVDVPMMHQTESAGYLKGDTFALLDLPYERGDLSMIVLLPKEVGGLPALEKELTAEKLGTWLAKRQPAEVRLTLPKFKMTSEFLLNGALAKLGMKKAFDPKQADFSGMTTRDQLFISAVVHKAFVDVHEAGTEAAAATAVVMEKKDAAGGVPEPIPFTADHPFIFLVRDNRTGSVLFMGRVARP